MRLLVSAALLALLPAETAKPGDDPPVRVVIDMDANTAGIQSSVTVPSCTAMVAGVSVWIIDPTAQRSVWSIGYLGGIDRGISFGHVPDAANNGWVAALSATAATPVTSGSGGIVVPAGLDPAFAGPEIQYIEWGAVSPTRLSADPAGPVFTVDVSLVGAQPGDRFDFHLADFISIWGSFWIGQASGAFSTQGPTITLDTGGDAIADGTPTIYGPDADVPAPLPGAAFLVDYVDGPATIEVVPAPGDLDRDGDVDVDDLLGVLLGWGECPGCTADVTGDGTVDVDDLTAVILGWSSCVDPQQALCEETDGVWDPLSCGHYLCGWPPACTAVVPGCDCGPDRRFVDGLGCVEDDDCPP